MTFMYGDAFSGEALDPRLPVGAGLPVRPSPVLGWLVAIAVLRRALVVAAGTAFVALDSTHSWFPKQWDRTRRADRGRKSPSSAVSTSCIRSRSGTSRPKAFEKQLGDERRRDAAECGPSRARRSSVPLGRIHRRQGRPLRRVRHVGVVGHAWRSTTLRDRGHHRAGDDARRRAPRDARARVDARVCRISTSTSRSCRSGGGTSNSGDSVGAEGACRRRRRADPGRLPASSCRPADQKEYAREDRGGVGNRVDRPRRRRRRRSSNLLSGAPYQFGPSTVRVLLESGGNRRRERRADRPGPVDRECSPRPVMSTLAVPVDAPMPSADGTVVKDGPESFGPFEMFLTLAHADRPGPRPGGRRLGRRRPRSPSEQRVTCYRVAVAPNDRRSRESSSARCRTGPRAGSDLDRRGG